MAARIGEQLVSEGLVSAEQVEEALRAQVVGGGRIGTNLIELGFLSLDVLGEALARQHGIPAALTPHFEACDREVQMLLTPEMAAKWHAVPLGRLSTSNQIAVASTDPLADDGFAELHAEFGEEVVLAIAPELRILYWLEKTYAIRRPNRYRRTGPIQVSLRDERRGYVDTIGSGIALQAPGALAKVAVRRIAVPRSEVIDVEDLASVKTAVKAMKRATGRDRVGKILVHAMQDLLSPHVEIGMILIVRESLAIGWRGFIRGGDRASIEALAVPLNQPCLLSTVYESGETYLGGVEPTVLDQAMFAHLGCEPPGGVMIVPVDIFHRRACLIYGHSRESLPKSVSEAIASLANGLAASFERLVRAAQR